MKHIELFAGIGGFRRALDTLQQDGIMSFKNVGYSEIDKFAKKTYQQIHKIEDDELDIGDIVSFTADVGNIKMLPDFDLITGGFPCQAFSSIGKRRGFDDDRGQMFFRIMDIVKVKRPKYLLLENVRGLLSHDKGNTFKRITEELESEGYNVFHTILNSADFDIPQRRKRVIIFATTQSISKDFRDKYNAENIKSIYEKEKTGGVSLHEYSSVLDILDKSVDGKYYLSDKMKKVILRKYKPNVNVKINRYIASTMTATQGSHRADEDNYYDDDFIKSNGEIDHSITDTLEEQQKLSIRKLTPEEAFALQGFSKEDAKKAKEAGISDTQLYKQSGNAVTVNMIYAAMLFLAREGVLK